MIAACPRCSTRYRLAAERLRTEGVRLRCTHCQSVFRVYPPHTGVPRRRDDPAVEAELTPPPRPPDPERLVLVATADPTRGKDLGAEVLRIGLQPLVVDDGVEALLALHRTPAHRVVLDAVLPRLSGLELCEVMKRNPALRDVRCLLIGSAETLAPAFLLRAAGFGPDASLELADLPEALADVLRRFGVAGEGAPAAAPGEGDVVAPATPGEGEAGGAPEPALFQPVRAFAPAPETAPASAPEATQTEARRPEESTPIQVDPDAAVARAERLARIVISDLVLYNAERFERAALEDRLLEELASELEEGRALLRQRLPAHVLSDRDFLVDELLRVAATRYPPPEDRR